MDKEQIMEDLEEQLSPGGTQIFEQGTAQTRFMFQKELLQHWEAGLEESKRDLGIYAVVLAQLTKHEPNPEGAEDT